MCIQEYYFKNIFRGETKSHLKGRLIKEIMENTTQKIEIQ